MVATRLGRRFWTLWAAFSTASLGDGITYVAFPLLAVELTDDARLVALVAAARFLPFLVVGLPAGVVIDRVDRRWLAAAAQAGRAVVLVALAVVVTIDLATPWLVAVAAFVIGLGEVVTDGGLPAIVRDLVRPDQLEVANSRMSATQTVTNYFIGPPAGAFLFTAAPSVPFVVSGLVFVAAALALAGLPGRFRPARSSEAPPSSGPDERASGGWARELTVGLRYVWGHPVLRPLAMTVAAFAFAGEAGNAVFVLLVTERLGLSAGWYGILISLDAAASVVTSFFVARLVARIGHAGSMRVAVIAYALSAVMFGTVTAVPLFALAMVASGVSDPTWNVVSATIRQRLVPDELFGRMMTAYLVLAWSLQPVGAMVGGVVADAWGPEWVYLGAAVVVSSLLVLGRPLFRQVSEAMAPGVARQLR
jgi:MFS family permease